MKGRSWTTAILLVCLLLAIVGALAWFQVHQHQLGQEAVAHGKAFRPIHVHGHHVQISQVSPDICRWHEL